MNKLSYRKLGGAEAFSLFLQSRLYLADDHLLIQKSSTFSHNYQRFFLKDIQSVYMLATKDFILWAIVWGAQLLAAPVLFRLMDWEPVVMVPWILIAFIGTVMTVFRGPSCKTYLETVTQTVKLPGLNSQRKSLKVLNQLKQAIEALQGELNAADMASTSEMPRARRVEPRPITQPTTPHWFHYAFWLVNAVLLGWVYLKGRSDTLIAIYMIAYFFSFLSALMAVVSTVRKRQRLDPLAWTTCVGFGMVLVRGFVTYLFVVFLAAMNQVTGADDVMRYALEADFLDNSNYRVWLDIEMVISLFLGAIGLFLCFTNALRRKPGETP